MAKGVSHDPIRVAGGAGQSGRPPRHCPAGHARSQDLASWELSPFNPILEASAGEGINNSDVDLFEYEGNTYLFYATGDQATWGAVRVVQYAGPMNEFFAGHFPADLPTIKLTARR